MLKGIDVSTHNGVIDWERVKTQIDYAIIRCGYGSDQTNQDDKYFKRNVEECIRLGIPFGIYLYSYANTLEKANSEAEHVLRLMNPYKDKVTMGIWYDIEDKIQANLDKNLLTNIITTFCNKIENNGYYVGIYANKNWLENRIDNSLKERYVIWIAQYNSKCTWNGKYAMWQYTSDGYVDGINGRVDMNYSYQDRFIVEGQVLENKPVVESKPIQKDTTVLEWQKMMNRVYNCGLAEDNCFGTDSKAKANKYCLYRKRPLIINEHVKFMQNRLCKHGFNVDVDSKFGPDCELKTKRFQASKGLKQDSKIGANTTKELLK